MAQLKEIREQPCSDKKAIDAEGLGLFQEWMEISQELIHSNGLAGAVASEEKAKEETEQEKYDKEKEKKRVAQEKATRLAILRGLPSLINTKTGIVGCTIAKYKEQSVAVISLPIVRCFFEEQYEGIWEDLTDNDVMRFFGRVPGSVTDEILSEVEVDFRGVDFRDMILQTPFKPTFKNMTKKQLFVCEASSWKKIIEDFRGDVLPVEINKKKVERFGQQYASCKGKVKVFQLGHFKIPSELKPRIPAFGEKWTKEQFSAEFVEFFQIPSLSVGKVHIVNSIVT